MSLSTVVTMGYEIGSMGLVTTLGYGQGAAPPPPPPVTTTQVYGPALTPAERQRWFGDYCPPDERERLQKERERCKRLELGIIKALPPLKPAVKEAVREVVQERVVEALPDCRVRLDEKSIIQRIAREISLDLKSVVKEGKELRALQRQRELQRLEDEEEEEAVEVATLFMLH